MGRANQIILAVSGTLSLLRFVVYSLIGMRSRMVKRREFVCSSGLRQGTVCASYQTIFSDEPVVSICLRVKRGED
jgi:hypothetical protein